MKQELSILGVPGTVEQTPHATDPALWVKQVWRSNPRTVTFNEHVGPQQMTVTVRYDDSCGNRVNSFSITADVSDTRRGGGMGGCCHKEIEQVFPELAPLIKWHGMNSDGPAHYVANTTYMAGDRDHNGLAEGEKRQMLALGKTPMWNLRADATGCRLKFALELDEDLTSLPIRRLQDLISADEMPTAAPRLFWAPCWQVGEGKGRDLAAARRTAIWSEATDEQLCLPKAELTKLLEERLPGLIEQFRADIASTGLRWSPEA